MPIQFPHVAELYDDLGASIQTQIQQIQPLQTIVCYPISNISRPIDMFGAFPKSSTHFVPVSPPPPPCRLSSKSSATLRIYTDVHAVASKSENIKPKMDTNRSKSTGSVYSTSFASSQLQKDEKNFTNNSRLVRRNYYRMSSVSPVGRRPSEPRKLSASPIAFGRSISKERTFAEEKKKLEEQNPLCRRAFTASTSILRNPELKSPDEVKRAIKSKFQIPQDRKLTRPSVSSVRTVDYKVSKFEKGLRKSVSVTLSSKGKPIPREVSTLPLVRNSRSTESRYLLKSKQTKQNGSTSNLSVARTSSTYSIDSISSTSRKSNQVPHTITRSASSDRSVFILNGKPRKKKSSSREKLSIVSNARSVKPEKATSDKSVNQQIHDAINQEILNHTQPRSIAYYQNSLTVTSPTLEMSSLPSVQHKAHIWNNIVSRQDEQNNIYSDFRQWERHSRSLSPRRVYKLPDSRFDCFTQLSNDEEQFGPNGTLRISRNYEERSRSVPQSRMVFTEVHQPNEPIVILGRNETTTSSGQYNRSPSCRRIQSYRSNQRQSNSIRVSRTRSLGSQSDRKQTQIVSSRSSSALNANTYENHTPSCTHDRSDRFNDLNRFYTNLERVAHLEKATSSGDVRPIRKQGEVIDFEEWQRIRQHEKAQKELNYLVGKIKADEKEKDLLFRTRYPEDHKWSFYNDSGLRIKEKSVEDLKEILKEKSLGLDAVDNVTQQQIETDKGKYKSMWRGNSVLDLASNMVMKYNPDEKASTLPKKVNKYQQQERRFDISTKLMSTLSADQVSTIKQQLSEIYNPDIKSGQVSKDQQYFVEVSGDRKIESHGLTVRSNSMSFREQHSDNSHQTRFAEYSENIDEPSVSESVCRYEDKIKREEPLSETEKRSILQTLSKEIQDKVKERRDHSLVMAKETRGAIASDSARNTLTKQTPDKPARKELKGNTNPFLDVPSDRPNTSDEVITPEKHINNTIEFFEKKQVEPPPEPTIYRAREYSSQDEEEIQRSINENSAAKRIKREDQPSPHGLSSSVSDFKELFGETNRNLNSRPSSPATIVSPNIALYSNSTSIESVFRSQSVSPLHTRANQFPKVYTGEVQKIKDRFESLNHVSSPDCIVPVRRFKSDPELNKSNKVSGDVSWITHKFETTNSASAARSRSRTRKTISPIPRVPFKRTDRLMPHIDIISKKIDIINQEQPKVWRSTDIPKTCRGDVQSIRNRFEAAAIERDLSVLGEMFTSSPDISELRDISSYLTGKWIAHKFPKRRDNALSPDGLKQSQDKDEIIKKRKTIVFRPLSSSPPRCRSRISPILKPFFRMAGHEADEDDVRKRHVADKCREVEQLWRKIQQQKKNVVAMKHSVTFQG